MGEASNLDWKRPGDDLELVEGDIRDRALVERVMAGKDWVVHEAAVASVGVSVSEPELTNEVKLTASLGLLEAGIITPLRWMADAAMARTSCSTTLTTTRATPT